MPFSFIHPHLFNLNIIKSEGKKIVGMKPTVYVVFFPFTLFGFLEPCNINIVRLLWRNLSKNSPRINICSLLHLLLFQTCSQKKKKNMVKLFSFYIWKCYQTNPPSKSSTSPPLKVWTAQKPAFFSSHRHKRECFSRWLIARCSSLKKKRGKRAPLNIIELLFGDELDFLVHDLLFNFIDEAKSKIIAFSIERWLYIWLHASFFVTRNSLMLIILNN